LIAAGKKGKTFQKKDFESALNSVKQDCYWSKNVNEPLEIAENSFD